jgi:hypothetical protein
MVFEHQMSFRIFDTQLGVQCMEYICELWHYLVPFLSQCGPSHVMVIVASNRVVLFLNTIPEIIPSWVTANIGFLSGLFLTKSLPPILDMGDGLKDCKGNIFSFGKIMDRKIPF